MVRGLLKFVFLATLIVGGVIGAVVLVLILMNSRDPYGGPIEPSAPH